MSNPTIIGIEPINEAIDVPVNIVIRAHFSQGTGYWPLDSEGVNNNTVYAVGSDNNKIHGDVDIIDNYTISFSPHFNLQGDTLYNMYLIGDTDLDNNSIDGIKDIQGNPMYGLYTWSFTTEEIEEGQDPEEDPPSQDLELKIINTKPRSNSVNIKDIDTIELEFSENLNLDTINNSNIYIIKKSNS